MFFHTVGNDKVVVLHESSFGVLSSDPIVDTHFHKTCIYRASPLCEFYCVFLVHHLFSKLNHKANTALLWPGHVFVRVCVKMKLY